MNKKHEVEFRALLTDEMFKYFLERGKNISKSNIENPIIIEDAYFCPQKVQSFSEIEMDEIGSYSLRLRRETKKDKTDISMNTKIIQNVGDHNAWLEHEVIVSSFEETRRILEAIGFKCFFEFKKRRYSFHDGEINVCLEDIDKFQPAIEIEILATEDKTAEAKQTLLDYLGSNNVPNDAIIKKSITNILMKKLAKF